MRKVDQCSDEMKTVEKNLLRWHVRRDGMRWEELRWGEKSSHDLRWDEVPSVKCKCEVRSAGCEVCTVKCEESIRLALHCTGVARRSCSWTTSAQQLRTKHARTGLASARRIQVLYMIKVCSISLRQLPPRLVRILWYLCRWRAPFHNCTLVSKGSPEWFALRAARYCLLRVEPHPIRLLYGWTWLYRSYLNV